MSFISSSVSAGSGFGGVAFGKSPGFPAGAAVAGFFAGIPKSSATESTVADFTGPPFTENSTVNFPGVGSVNHVITFTSLPVSVAPSPGCTYGFTSTVCACSERQETIERKRMDFIIGVEEMPARPRRQARSPPRNPAAVSVCYFPSENAESVISSMREPLSKHLTM